jgi:thiamine transport system permease protein
MFFRVTLPLLAPAVASGFVLIFIYTFLSFGIILVFGGVQFATLEVAIYQEMFIDLDLITAGVYSLVQLAISTALIAISTKAINATRVPRVSDDRPLPNLSDASPTARLLMGGYALLALLFVLGPIVTMIARAFTDVTGLPSFENFRELFVPGAAERNVESILRSSVPGVIVRSIGIAAASGTLTFLVAAAVALSMRGKRSTGYESFLQLPIGMSLVTVSLGLRFVWDGVVPPVMLIVIGQFFIAFPLVFRIVRTGVEELGPGPVSAAEILGAGRWPILRDIEAPLLRRTFLNAYAYALALPFADLTVVLAAGRGRIATFPVAIYRLIGFRSFDLALALAVVYIAICLVLFMIIDATSLSRRMKP